MTLWDRLAGLFGYTKAEITAPPAWLQAEAISSQYEIPERTLPTAQLELYQRLSWIQIAVGNVAGVVSTTPLNVGKRTGEETDDVPNHPFELLLARPNPLMSRAELMESTISDYALTGNSYWWLNKAGEKSAPDELWVIPPHRIRPMPDGRQFIRGYLYDAENGTDPIVLQPWEICHFKRYHPLSPFVGLSPIESLAIVSASDLNMQRYNANYFDKGNAKPQGALAFKDPIDDTSWAKIKNEVKGTYGGTKREMMMLRGAGDGVSYISMALSQADMQFIEGRTFTKEEIFAIYAPGLSSVLSVNATEANSIAGRKTFIELGVWPHLTRMAEKVTNDILPLYGPNLVGEFEDIRITDRAMALQEQAAFERVATVNEVRQKFYQLDELGDDRGTLLVLEVGKGLTRTEEPPPPVIMQPGQQPGDKPAVDGEQPPPGEDAPTDEPPDEQAQQAEAKALRRWLKRRPKADPAQFETLHLSDADVKAIVEEIRGVATEQPFFTQAGKATPNDGNDKERAKLERYHADKLQQALRRILRAVAPPGTTVDNITPDKAVERYREAQGTLRDALVEMLMDGAQLGADTGIAQAESMMGIGKAASITGTNWDLVNENVLRWVLGGEGFGFGNGYADVVTQALASTSETQIRRNVGEWISNGLPYGTLLDNLERTVFSRRRAETISTTEITRAFAIGNEQAWQESRVIGGKRWNTAVDELVCAICRPLNGVIAKLGEDWVHPETQQRYSMPAHPRDRCWPTPVPIEDMPQ